MTRDLDFVYAMIGQLERACLENGLKRTSIELRYAQDCLIVEANEMLSQTESKEIPGYDPA